ncbi:hypothetical protein AcW1_006913 [Taiwanofungus camphoratus]|nr:hypothetical protein AcW1_006913 [Antrodia cinnamomea]
MFHHSSDSLALPDDSAYMNKDSNGPLYVQHRTLEIIQLTEVPAPPRAQFPSTITSSSSASSSYISSSSDPEEESVCSSYCSSDPEESVASSPDDTYTTRLMRVLTWRESFAKAMGTPLPFPQPLPAPPLKRKADVDHQDSDDEAVGSLSPMHFFSVLTVHYVGVSFVQAFSFRPLSAAGALERKTPKRTFLSRVRLVFCHAAKLAAAWSGLSS